jgi:Zn-dependent protease with chaperone function
MTPDQPTVYRRDRQLMSLSLGIGILLWGAAFWLAAPMLSVAVAVGLLFGVLLVVLVLGISYLFAHSAFVAHLRGQGIEVSAEQLPEIHQQLESCCTTLGVSPPPRLFILNGNGVLNAFATWFLGRRFVILNSDIVDAMDSNPAGVRFYLGHELGHILRHDAPWMALLRWPALRLPLLGAAFSRARESSCDLHGLACCPDRESAARSLAALAAGKRQWAALSLAGARRQAEEGTGFFMTFHELTGSYPWTAKRIVRVLDESPTLPRRHPLGWLLASFIPYAGRVGAGIGLLLYVYVIGIGAAILIPRYQALRVQATLAQADTASMPLRRDLTNYYLHNHEVPASLEAAGLASSADLPQPKGPPLHLEFTLNPRNMSLQVQAGTAGLQYVPSKMDDGSIHWACTGIAPLPKDHLPPACTP